MCDDLWCFKMICTLDVDISDPTNNIVLFKKIKNSIEKNNLGSLSYSEYSDYLLEIDLILELDQWKNYASDLDSSKYWQRR